MAETFHLSVLTPERSVIETEVVSIVAPGAEGYLGVLAHHAPLITPLIPGKLTVKEPDLDAAIYAVSGGFLEVSGNKAVILADSIEKAEEIDVERARRARERAEERLRKHDAMIDEARAEAALGRAINRIRIGSPK
jgi:F-type H+-transporting ATPase subunit epsilon